MSFVTQFKIWFLLPFTCCGKVLGKMSVYKLHSHILLHCQQGNFLGCPKWDNHISKIASVTTFFSLLVIVLATENHVRRSIKSVNQILLPIFTKSMATVSLKSLAIGNQTTGRGLVFLYLIQMSQDVISSTASIIDFLSVLAIFDRLIKSFNFSAPQWQNWRCNLITFSSSWAFFIPFLLRNNGISMQMTVRIFTLLPLNSVGIITFLSKSTQWSLPNLNFF